jgi:hypothetical protein
MSTRVLKKYDLVILFSCLFLFAVLYWVTAQPDAKSIAKVRVEQAGAIVYQSSKFADEPEIIAISGPLGESRIEISRDGVAMIAAPCPDQCCVLQGRIVNGVIVCVPQKIIVSVEGVPNETDYDAILH